MTENFSPTYTITVTNPKTGRTRSFLAFETDIWKAIERAVDRTEDVTPIEMLPETRNGYAVTLELFASWR